MEEITVHLKIDDIGFKVIGPQHAQRKIEKFLMNNIETEKQNAALMEALENIMCVHNSNFGSYIKEVNFIAEQALKGEESS